MLEITIPAVQAWDEEKEMFVETKEQNLKLEHSLISLSKWESKWCKPFLSKTNEKSFEETIDYVRCMTLTPNVDPEAYLFLTNENIEQINHYIDYPASATTITDRSPGTNKGKSEIVTSELIYYWMVAFNIPFECQKWHLNRLLNLVRICEIKNSPQKKMGRNEIMRQNAAINAARRKKLHTNG